MASTEQLCLISLRLCPLVLLSVDLTRALFSVIPTACWTSGYWTHPHWAACGWRWWSIYTYYFYYSRVHWFINQSINQQISLPSDCMNINRIKTDKICNRTPIPMQFAKAQYTPPTRLNSIVASRQRCVLGIPVCLSRPIRLRYHIEQPDWANI